MNELWQILVPTISNSGKPFRTRFHRVFDAKVRAITGGLTVFQPTIKGEWVAPDGTVFKERMIPVSFTGNEEVAEQISDLVATMYQQDAVLYYRLSDRTVIKHYDAQPPKAA